MATAKWALAPTHSEVQFKVKHLVISTVIGSFKKFAGEADTAGDSGDNARVRFPAAINSIDTNQEQYDGPLKSAGFFAAATYPRMIFEPTSFEKVAGGDYKLSGELTLSGVTRPVTFDGEYRRQRRRLLRQRQSRLRADRKNQP
ncbi:hypothetical protein GCM10022408_29290 [Hymenobacter fastidiosus]|uniref:Lipid/polyisoprenoid-binding YceI-like domain-containing protein n=1 Tax=Hymenobacter fastidiosus TaxID=486264 RepID=A0ABP7SNH9_9BACT